MLYYTFMMDNFPKLVLSISQQHSLKSSVNRGMILSFY